MASVFLAWGELPLRTVVPVMTYASMVFIVGWLIGLWRDDGWS